MGTGVHAHGYDVKCRDGPVTTRGDLSALFRLRPGLEHSKPTTLGKLWRGSFARRADKDGAAILELQEEFAAVELEPLDVAPHGVHHIEGHVDVPFAEACGVHDPQLIHR